MERLEVIVLRHIFDARDNLRHLFDALFKAKMILIELEDEELIEKISKLEDDLYPVLTRIIAIVKIAKRKYAKYLENNEGSG